MADRHNRDIDRPLAPAPKPLPVPTVDAHAHLEIVTDAAPDSDAVKQVLDDAKAAGVDRGTGSRERARFPRRCARIDRGAAGSQSVARQYPLSRPVAEAAAKKAPLRQR